MITANRLQKVIYDLQEIQKSVYPGNSLEVQQATKILSKKLRQGLIYPEEITLERLMSHGLTEIDSEQILIILKEQELF